MNDLTLYLGMIVLGYVVGVGVRRAHKSLPWTEPALICIVAFLVFTMGLRIGANEDVVSHLDLIGLYALVVTVVVLVFTGVALHCVRRMMGLDRYGMVRGAFGGSEDTVCKAADRKDTPRGIDKMTLCILLAVAGGVLAGFLTLRFSLIPFAVLNNGAAWVIRVGLCGLLLLIGFDLGFEGTVVASVRQSGLRIVVVPITVVVATAAAAAVCSLFLPVSLRESLAIGAGFGWYSLAPGIIMDQGYLTAGAIAFLHNVLREILAIVVVPVVARHIGYIECSGLGGATAMDVGLPVVEQSTNSITAVYAFISGAVLSSLVPVLVPLILTV